MQRSESSRLPRQRSSRWSPGEWAAYSESIGYPGAAGAVLYVSTPGGAYFASTGMTNASPGIHFRIASNTKTFTAAAIMLLHQRGLLRIDDVLTANIPGTTTPYVPDTASYAIPYKGSITIRQLLGHRAGVYDVTNEDMPVDAPCPYAGKSYVQTQDMSRQFTFDELVGVDAMCNASYWPPSDDRYRYSNTGYSLLGKVIERVSGLSYSDFVVRNLLVPNRLTETSSPSLHTETTLPAPFAVGYSLDYMGIGEARRDGGRQHVDQRRRGKPRLHTRAAGAVEPDAPDGRGRHRWSDGRLDEVLHPGRRDETATASGSSSSPGSASVTPGPTMDICRSCCTTRPSTCRSCCSPA